MRCLICEALSSTHICSSCQKENLTPSLYTRKILGNIKVYSFYKYRDIEPLLLTKHTDLGAYLYKIMATLTFEKFANEFHFEARVASISIDDHVKHGYSHTAILNRALNSNGIKPYYGKLRAHSKDTYSGKDYQYRLLHPRKFKYKSFKENDVIVVDDIITTGLTLTQAVETLTKAGKNVLFCLTLADADKVAP